MHQTSVDGVDDMANLGDLHDAAILHNLHLRYKSDKIYVSLILSDSPLWLHRYVYCLEVITFLPILS